jgi:tRNA threonylcarbamoyladenosine biosynthesis protein TsaE
MAEKQWDFRLSDIARVAAEFWSAAGGAKVFALHGEMGAGKTTFVHALCDARGVRDPVGSPTFSLVNQYIFMEGGSERSIYHIDLYRVEGEEEAIRAGIEDCLWSGAICFVEWPERAPALLPPGTLQVHIRSTGPDSRHINLDGDADNH